MVFQSTLPAENGYVEAPWNAGAQAIRTITSPLMSIYRDQPSGWCGCAYAVWSIPAGTFPAGVNIREIDVYLYVANVFNPLNCDFTQLAQNPTAVADAILWGNIMGVNVVPYIANSNILNSLGAAPPLKFIAGSQAIADLQNHPNWWGLGIRFPPLAAPPATTNEIDVVSSNMGNITQNPTLIVYW